MCWQQMELGDDKWDDSRHLGLEVNIQEAFSCLLCWCGSYTIIQGLWGVNSSPKTSLLRRGLRRKKWGQNQCKTCKVMANLRSYLGAIQSPVRLHAIVWAPSNTLDHLIEWSQILHANSNLYVLGLVGIAWMTPIHQCWTFILSTLEKCHFWHSQNA